MADRPQMAAAGVLAGNGWNSPARELSALLFAPMRGEVLHADHL